MRPFPIPTRLATLAATGVFLGPALAADPAPQDYSGNVMHDLLVLAGEARRAAIADGYLRSVGNADCDVTRLSFRKFDPADQTSLWRADCKDGRSFALTFDAGADRMAEVLPCPELASLGGSCF